MFKALPCCLTLLAIAIGEPADVQPPASDTQSTEQHHFGPQTFLPHSKRGFRASSTFRLSMSIPVSSSHLRPRSRLCALPACCPIQEHKWHRTIEPCLLNTTRSPSTTTPREPSICPRAGPAPHRPSYPCSFMRWFITFKMC